MKRKFVGFYYRCSSIIFLWAFLTLIGLMFLSSSALAAVPFQSGDYTCYDIGGTITTVGYTGPGGVVVVPATIEGKPVVSIGIWTFYNCTSLTSVTIPDSVTSIGYEAFGWCSNLTKAYFLGNAPSMGWGVFSGYARNFTICYTAESTGFSTPKWEGYPAKVCEDNQCAAEAIYGETSEQTELLREYRDNVLSKTSEGQETIKAYYKFSPAVTKLLEQMPLLKNRAKAFIDRMLPGIRKKVEESNKEQ